MSSIRSINNSGLNLSFILTTLIISWPAVSYSDAPDNCEFIRAQLLNPEIREVVIPAGIYTCNKPIVVNRSGTSLRGEGLVTLQLADHANCPLLVLGNIETPPEPVHNIKIANLILEGNREQQDMECWGGPCDTGGITLIRNNGITIRGVHQAHIKDVQIYRMRSGGVVTEKVCTKLHIDGLVAKDNYFDGFAGYETTDSLFENLDLSENLAAGISLDIHFNGNIFKNIKLKKNKNVGVFMRDSHHNKFYDLRIEESGSHGVFISQVDDQLGTSPTNNVFQNLVVAGAKGNGFHLNQGTCVGNELINAKFFNISEKDIFETVRGTLKVWASLDAKDCSDFFANRSPDGRSPGVSVNAWDRNIRTYRERGWLENRGR